MPTTETYLENAIVAIDDETRALLITGSGEGGVTPTQASNINGSTYRANVTIANGAAVSNAIALADYKPRGASVLVPNGWTAADLTIDASFDGSTWYPVKDDAGALLRVSTIATNEADIYALPAKLWTILSVEYIRLRSIAAGGTTNQNQTNAKNLTVIFVI